jgi:endonuclease/exonuclease/phosphatase family metal-dependent hydrolase
MALNDPRFTTVEILTFNMDKNAMALGEVMSSLKKNTDLIVICLQESTEHLTTCEQRVCSFLEHYKCKDRVEHGFKMTGKVQIFALQRKDVDENFTFSHEIMPFHSKFLNLKLYRPWKGAIFLKCTSQRFCRPFVFIGAHFHAHEGVKYVQQRKNDLQQIIDFIKQKYRTYNWCLFGDLNFRTTGSSEDEFQQYFREYNIKEHPSTGENTFKIDKLHRTGFDQKRRPSRTDRICHNDTQDITIEEYGVVTNSAAPETAAGAGSDHKPVYEMFCISHRSSTTATPFLVSY